MNQLKYIKKSVKYNKGYSKRGIQHLNIVNENKVDVNKIDIKELELKLLDIKIKNYFVNQTDKDLKKTLSQMIKLVIENKSISNNPKMQNMILSKFLSFYTEQKITRLIDTKISKLLEQINE